MSNMPATAYGFIGLGQMGHGMAKNIRKKIDAASPLVIYDVNLQAMEQFIKEHEGAKVIAVSSPKEVAEQADVIMTSVPQAKHVEAVYEDPQTGLLVATKVDSCRKLYMELSTIDAEVSTRIGARITSGGYGDFVDAPCSGGRMGAESGNLSFMVGCSEDLYPRVLEICKLMASESSIFHCGNLGAGLKTKLLNNYLSSLTALATAETFNIGIRSGLDASKLNEVLNASSGMNFNSKVNNPVPGLTPKNAASNGYNGGFSIELCLGVLELAVRAGEDLGATMVLGKPMLNAYRDVATVDGFKGKDSKIIYKWLGGGDPILS